MTDVIVKANNISTEFYHSFLLGSSQPLEYLKSRGLSMNSIEKFKLGFATNVSLIGNLLRAKGLPFSHLVKKDNDSEDYFKERIVIPFLDGDNTIFFTSRSIYDIGTRHLHLRGGIPTLYNSNTLLDAKYVFIVESPLDAITLEQNGIRAVAKLGTGLNLLENLLIPQIFLIPDIEESRVGEIDAIKTAAYLYSIGNIDVRIVYLPSNGVKVDPNLWFMDHTIEEFRKLPIIQARDVEPIIFPGLHGPETFTFEQAAQKTRVKKDVVAKTGDEVAEIKRKANLLEIMRDYTNSQGIQTGEAVLFLCPLHNDRNPSLAIYPATQSWCCFGGCGGGDVINFIQRIEDINFKQALELIKTRYLGD